MALLIRKISKVSSCFQNGNIAYCSVELASLRRDFFSHDTLPLQGKARHNSISMREQTLSRIRFEIQQSIDSLKERQSLLVEVLTSVRGSIENIEQTLERFPDLRLGFEPILASLKAKRDELEGDLQILQAALSDLEDLKKKYSDGSGDVVIKFFQVINGKEEEINSMKISFSKGGECRAEIKTLAPDSRPAPIDGKLEWYCEKEVSDENGVRRELADKVADLEVSEDSKNCKAKAQAGGELGKFFLIASGDADLGSEKRLIKGEIELIAELSEAGVVELSEVLPEPAAG